MCLQFLYNFFCIYSYPDYYKIKKLSENEDENEDENEHKILIQDEHEIFIQDEYENEYKNEYKYKDYELL